MPYQIIYSDPPWRFNNKKTGGSMKSGAEAKYPTMTVNQICDLKVPAGENCILFMWWVASMPQQAIQVAEAWGFKIKTMTGFTWIKTTKHGKPFFGMGFHTRQSSENCLIAVKGNIKRVNAGVRSVITAPIEKHSKKPDVFRNEIVRLMGNLSRLEMFARQNYEGWDAFGNEIENSIELKESL